MRPDATKPPGLMKSRSLLLTALASLALAGAPAACEESCEDLECPLNFVCADGECRCGLPYTLSELCGEECLYVDDDPQNCGGCGVRCLDPAAPFCSDGRCTCGGGTVCAGRCANLEVDHDDCGECGNACPLESICYHSECVSGDAGCDPPCQTEGGELCCADGAGLGQCVNLYDYSNHCGGCGIECPADHECQDAECVPFESDE